MPTKRPIKDDQMVMNGFFTHSITPDITPEINVETITGYKAFEEILALPEYAKTGGVVIGRKDMSLSMGLSREEMDSDALFTVCRDIFTASKKKYPDKKCTLGGINSFGVINFLRKFPPKTIDRYEMRKSVFLLGNEPDQKIKEGIIKGLQFEILWYENKKRYYEKIAGEDSQYLERSQNKCKKMLSELKA